MLSVTTVARLLPRCYPHDWLGKQTVQVKQGDCKFPYEWCTMFWNWVQQHVNDISLFEGQFVVPLVTSYEHSSMCVTKLVPNSSIILMENSDNCHASLLDAFDKLHIQCVSLWHFKQLQHRQLFRYLNKYNPLGVLTAISNSGCRVSKVMFTDFEATEMQRFLVSQNLYYQFSVSHKNIIQNLHIFSVLNHSSRVSITGAARTAWKRQVILEPSNFTFTSDSLPTNLVILSSSLNQHNLIEVCDNVSLPRSMISFLLDVLFQMIRNGSCPEDKIDTLMEHVLRCHFPILHWNYAEFTSQLSNLPFIRCNERSCTRKAPTDLYDSSDNLLKNIFLGMPVFPLAPFNRLELLHCLRLCNLRTIVSGNDLFKLLCQIVPDSEFPGHPQWASKETITQLKAILSYIDIMPRILHDEVYMGHYPFMSSSFLQQVQCFSKKWLPILFPCPKNYPSCLSWKGTSYNSHLISHHSDSVILCKQSDIENYALLIGSQMYIVESPQALCEGFEQANPTAYVLKHLLHLIDNKNQIGTSVLDKLVHHIYKYLNENISRCSFCDLSHQELIWVKQQHRFVAPNEIVLKRRPSFPHSLAPFFEILSDSLYDYSELFHQFGIINELSDSDIISVLSKIKDDEENKVSDDTAWKMVEYILTWLTDSGETHASEKLTDVGQTLLIPIQSHSKRPQLVDIEIVVYTDLEFLRSFESVGDKIYFIHERVAHLAVPLGVKALSTHLNISYDAFEDVGQHEPLITRLKNILKDYKDGLTIIKELLQNADDAGATEVTICYDARTHDVNPKYLLYKGMAKCHGPALLVHNNASFTNDDFENITKLAGATKMNKPLKIGKFGVGFCSVYHITDVPSFISGDWLYIFDPTITYLKDEIMDRARPGKKLPFRESLVHLSKQLLPYTGLFGFDQMKNYQGTLFRFPFRTSGSEISKVIYDETHIQSLLSELQQAGSKLLLFLNNLKKITFTCISKDKAKSTLFAVERRNASKISICPLPNSAELLQIDNECSEADIVERSKEIWLVVSETTNVTETNKPATAAVACSMQVDSTLNVYIPKQVRGEIFCYLPLSLLTGLPVHVSANFAVLNDRTGIHASDSESQHLPEEVEWNHLVMQNVVSKAYFSLLLALKNLCNDNSVSVNNYEFYSLWPLKESLKSHNPWDKMICYLYIHLSCSKLFYSACSNQWIDLSNAYILDNSVFSLPSSGGCGPPECVFNVFEQLCYSLIRLPYSYQSHITKAELSQCVIHEEQFLEIFFNNIASVSIKIRNEVLFMTLKKYAISSNNYVNNILVRSACVPCTPDGILLKKCCEIIDPSADFSGLYEDSEGVFPISDFYNDSLVHKALLDLNMIHDLLPWKSVVERAEKIKQLYNTSDHLTLLKMVKCILYCVQQHIQSSLLSGVEVPKELMEIPFLPVMKRQKKYPPHLPWSGDNSHFTKSKYIVRGEGVAMLAGSQVCIVSESSPKEGGCGPISNSVAIALGIRLFPSCDVVVSHLLQIVNMHNVVEEIDKHKAWIETACEQIYKFFEQILTEDDIYLTEIEKLKGANCVWTGQTFILPQTIAKSWSRNGPYLYCVPHLLVSKEKLLNVLGVQKCFTTHHYVSALEEVYIKHSEMPITEDRSLSAISDIANNLADEVDEVTDSRWVFYLPDKDGIMHQTQNLAYNDAQWCQLDEECHFVHHRISRPTALKLGVVPVRSKALEKYDSSIQDWDGVPFGQHEELTLRIQNILNEYPMDITVLKELLQNADDAGATKFYVILDKRTHKHFKLLSSEWKDLQGPALLVWNDRGFNESDLKGIQKLGLGSKRSNSETIGQYGIGFNVVYHLTDCPSFFTNGDTLCILDPHCRFVPGATPLKPGRMFERVGESFWNNWCDMKSSYLRDCESNFKCAPEMQQDDGTLFRFPLRHTSELVKKSKLVGSDSNMLTLSLSSWKMQEKLNKWAPKMKEALIFLRNVKELKFFVINDSTNSMLITHHFIAHLEKEALDKRNTFSERACQFTDNQHPFVVPYPIKLLEEAPKKLEERWLIQQGIGDIQNEHQHWEYIMHMKPEHGIAACISRGNVDNIHKVFCFLPLPLESRLPIHINGKFILDAARSGLWQSRDPTRPDDKQMWNNRLVEAAASSYVDFLVSCRKHYISSKPYNSSSELQADIKSYYMLFPRWDTRIKPEGEMDKLAHDVYKGLLQCNPDPDVLAIIKKCPVDSHTKKRHHFLVEWLPLKNDKDPSRQAYFWEAKEETKAIPPILKKLGIQLTVAPLFVRDHFIFNESDSTKSVLPLATPDTVFEYYSVHFVKMGSGLPCCITESVFGSVDSFITFVKYIVQDEHLDNVAGTFCKFPKHPVNIPLLLTADKTLRRFSDTSKVICSEFANVFKGCSEFFLHPDMFKLKLIPSYFVEPSLDNWPLIKGVLRRILPAELAVQRVRNASDKIDVEHLLSPLWKCLFKDGVFNVHLEDILREWTLIPSKHNELFSLKSCEGILPVIPPNKMKLKDTESSFFDIQSSSCSDQNEMMFQVMEQYKMPVLDTEIALVSLCRKYCPQLDQHSIILQNFYYLHRNGELQTLLKDSRIDSVIEILFTYFSAIHFSHEPNHVSLTRIKSLPLFKNIDDTYSSLPCEALIWPSSICCAGKDIWMKKTKQTSAVVFLKPDGAWTKLGEASVLGINEISTFLLYTRFIFPCYHLFSEQERLKHLVHIRDTSELFNAAWHDSKAEDDSDRKREAVMFISALKQLPCLLKSGELRPISDFYNPNITLFSMFLHGHNFPPSTMRDKKWLDFLNKIGLRVKATKEEFLLFCESVSNSNCSDLLKASEVLLNYLFMEDEWHDDVEFLTEVSNIPMACAENLKNLAWIYPCVDAQKIIKQGKKTFSLTSLRMAASFEVRNLVWTMKPIVKLPHLSYHHLKLSRKQWETKQAAFFHHLQVCTEPKCSDVINNIENISKSRFSQFKLFDTYTKECVAPKGKERFLFEVMLKCFTYLQDNNSDDSDMLRLNNLPCVPVCSDGNTTNLSSPVLVCPLQVIIYNQVEVMKLVPFLNPLPECLHPAYHKVLEVLGVHSEVRFDNVRFAMEIIHKNVKQPLKSKVDVNTIQIIKVLIKKLYLCLQTLEHSSILQLGVLYLPSRNWELCESTKLLNNDKVNYKSSDFNMCGVGFSFISLLVHKFDEIGEYKFTLNSLCNALPEPVRPLLLSSCSVDKLSSSCTPDEQCTDFAENVRKAFGFQDFAKVTKLMIGYPDGKYKDSCEQFSQAIHCLCRSVEVFSVHNLTVDVVLQICQPVATIGTAKMDFLLDTDSEPFCLYIDSEVNAFTYNFFESLTKSIISFASDVNKVDIKTLNQPERVISSLLKCPTTHQIKEMLHIQGISLANIELSGKANFDLTPKLGETIPEELHHRLMFDILNVFRPQEWVAYADGEDHFIFARIEYCIRCSLQDLENGELESNDNSGEELRRYLIITSEDDETGKEVSVIDLRKILRMKEITLADGSTELVLYDPDSEAVHLWDAVKCDKLKEMMKEICQELRRIWMITDKEFRRKAIKAMYLKWHPDKNLSPFATKAFQYLLHQINRLEKNMPLEDPDDEDSEEYEIPDQRADTYRRWDDIAASYSEYFRRERSGGGWTSHFDDHLQVNPDTAAAKVWLEQAECDLIALQTLLKEVDTERKVCAHVCFHAHQVAEKALKAGMFRLFGLQSSALKIHHLISHAKAIEPFVPTASVLVILASKLEAYYFNTRYPDVYFPPCVPSNKFSPDEARQAEQTSRTILTIIQSIIS